MRRRFPRWAPLLACAWLVGAGGCAVQRAPLSETPALAGRDAPVELAGTPFYPQEALNCGPAALATLLGAAGRAARPEALAEEVYTPGLGGSLQLELVAAARARGFLPYRVAPDADALAAELLAGRPVLVLQNLRLRSWPAWHYAVLVGADPAADAVVLRSGTERRLSMPAGRFMRTWDRAGRWGLVLLEPGELPARPMRAHYFDAVAGLEETGRHDAAAAAWQAALQHWPDDSVALFGLATAHHLAGRAEAARAGYRRLLALDPLHAAALNNLANLWAEQGCVEAARALARRAVAAAEPGTPIAAAAADTLRGLPTGVADAADDAGLAAEGSDAGVGVCPDAAAPPDSYNR